MKVELKFSKIIISNTSHFCILFFILLTTINCNIPALDRNTLELSRILLLSSRTPIPKVPENTTTVTNCSGSLLSWSPRLVPEANTWRSVAFGNGLFVAVSENGVNRVMTSRCE
ncbi:MAG: hypothetical protein CK427_12460 [Leptospira sp.]|nr:MAG: hypothetical protein CK427_12460 [Leptospira sp.]